MHAILSALANHAAATPERVAFRDGTGPDAPALTWADLHDRVQRLAAALDGAPGVVALDVSGGLDYVVADLGVTLSGRTLVPVPFFFSAEQRASLLRESGAGAVICARGAPPAPDTAGLPRIDLAALPPAPVPARAYRGGARRVIYTSGSSGRPKGVVLGDRQLAASVAALAGVVGAGPGDLHLSVLPLAQLLEQIAGIFLPILAGAAVVLASDATRALLGGPVAGLTAAMSAVRPTTSLLAPGLLGRWVADLSARGERAPDSLRFVAVGGAPTPPSLLAAAAAAGIPAHEGYGLSECCAVVAMNRPGHARPGTVGDVLDGITVTIEAGEIVVCGPTVMEGYLGGAPAGQRWRTGDLGRFDGDGRLVVAGRRDALIVTGAGRNISPEWVEARVDALPGVVASALVLRADDTLALVVAMAVPVPPDTLAMALADLPDWARPVAILPADPRTSGLIRASGTPDRAVAASLVDRCGAKLVPLRVDADAASADTR